MNNPVECYQADKFLQTIAHEVLHFVELISEGRVKMEPWDSSEEEDSPTSIELWNEYVDNGRLKLLMKSVTPTSNYFNIFANDFLSFCLTKVDLHFWTKFKIIVYSFHSEDWAKLSHLNKMSSGSPDEYLNDSNKFEWADTGAMCIVINPAKTFTPSRNYQTLIHYGLPTALAKEGSQYHEVILLNADRIMEVGKRLAELEAA